MRTSARIGRPLGLLTAVLVLQSAGCGDTHVGPAEQSALSISVTVIGVDTDEPFLISVDDRAPQPLLAATGFVFRSIASGKHTLTLGGFRENCSVDGPNPVVVDAPPAGEVRVDFRVTCTATTGVIAVAVAVSGLDEPTWFSLQVDSASPELIWGNLKTLVGSFPGGAHVVRLLDVPRFCAVRGDVSTSVSIKTGGLTQDTVLASFEVSCEASPERSDDGVIAFQRSDSIALVREDGSNMVLLTRGVAPSWSPDREFLAFQRPRCLPGWGCFDDLWMIRPDGSGAREITHSDAFYDSDPAVSPDARMVAFIRTWNGPDESYLMMSDLNGMSPVVLSIWDPYSTPTWSPDGTRIAFTCQGPAPTWELDICVVRTSGGCTSYFVNVCQGLPTIVHLTNSRFVESEPAWSRDGDRIAFTLACSTSACPPGVDDRESHVALLDPLTGAVTPMVPGHSPAWSPDGKRIVFSGNAGNPGLNVVNVDGTGLRRLTDDPRDTAPSWR